MNLVFRRIMCPNSFSAFHLQDMLTDELDAGEFRLSTAFIPRQFIRPGK